MRNSQLLYRLFTPVVAIALAMFTLISGCAAPKQTDAGVGQGFLALERKQFDEALSKADAYLREYPAGADSAEALYLRGRALEGRTAANPQQSRDNLQQARAAYIQALERKPSQPLEAYIHSSLGNVAYFQDDYSTALSEWTIAERQLTDDEVKSWVMYRKGISQQRLGQFTDADNTFADVQKRYPNSIPAQRAREHQGARSFSVQLATLANAANADATMNQLKQQGVVPTRTMDAQGRHVIRVGPVKTYADALALKARFASQYPDAIIVP